MPEFCFGKKSGRGFINGAEAQEESLARTSGLHESLLQAWDYYTIHRNMESCFYTDNMIYSPKVPVFRKDKGELLSKPVLCNFITSPAVNAGVVKKQEPERAGEILNAMDIRTDKMLSLALHQGNEVLILGAWGCGVFRNDPKEIAGLFKKYLQGNIRTNLKEWFSLFLPKRRDAEAVRRNTMKINLKKYKEQLESWPEKGYHIMAQYDDEKIIVYQSYKKE